MVRKVYYPLFPALERVRLDWMERVRLCAGARAIGTAYERPRVRADWTRGDAGPDFYADSCSNAPSRADALRGPSHADARRSPRQPRSQFARGAGNPLSRCGRLARRV